MNEGWVVYNTKHRKRESVIYHCDPRKFLDWWPSVWTDNDRDRVRKQKKYWKHRVARRAKIVMLDEKVKVL